ncbi:MAG: hypothetical protein Q4G63_01920 [Bacteroidia bacterium]|nr:hypothetical protein [Bacteroidia bacterium]
MDWEKELLALFDDPLLADVRPLPPKITQDDRLTQSFLEIMDWIGVNNREPSEDGKDFKEKSLYRRLQNIRTDVDKTAYLKEFDHLNLLK